LVIDIGWTSFGEDFVRKTNFKLSFCQGIAGVISPYSGPYPHFNPPKQIKENPVYHTGNSDKLMFLDKKRHN